MLDLSIIIVSWNVRDLLRQCLASIEKGRAELALEVIVVDSASADESSAMVAAEFPWVRLFPQTDNVGFTRGNNIGLKETKGRQLLLLNPDAEIVGDALTIMVQFLDAHPEVGALGPQLIYPDGQIQSSRRHFPSLATAFFESTWLQPIAPRSILEHYYVSDQPDDATLAVDWVMGACLMVRREAFDQVGPLDEGYFMYSEEMEWQRRMRDAGWQVTYLPTARVIHHEGKSSEQVAARRHIYFQQSKLRYFYQYHGRPAGTILRGFLLLNYLWQIGIEGTKGILGHKRALRLQRIDAYWQVLKTGLPPAGSWQRHN